MMRPTSTDSVSSAPTATLRSVENQDFLAHGRRLVVAAGGKDGAWNRAAPRACFSALDKAEQVGVDLLGVGGGHPVRIPGIGFGATRILNDGEAAETETFAQSATPRGRVRVSAPLSFGVGYLGAVLREFLEAYPEVVLDLALTDRHVDVVADGFDLAIRIASLEDSTLLARRLCTVRILLVGAPAYFDRHGRPTHPSQLTQHKALVYSGGSTRGVWRFSHPGFGEMTVEPPVQVWADNADLLTPLLLGGREVALQPEFLVWRELQAGLLERAMPEWSAPALGLHLLMPPGPLRPLRVQVLVDHLARLLARPSWGSARG